MGCNFLKATKSLQGDSLLFTNFFIIQSPGVAGTQLSGIFFVDATMKPLFLFLYVYLIKIFSVVCHLSQNIAKIS